MVLSQLSPSEWIFWKQCGISEDKITSKKFLTDFLQVDNACLLLAAAQASLTAPYQFDLHSIFFSEFLGVVKWLKVTHARKPSPLKSAALPKDILVNIKHFKFQLTDDPFEVSVSL
jgi:hypothetical protein